jgi:hypothetical protein
VVAAVLAAIVAAPAMAGGGGEPTFGREVIEETFFGGLAIRLYRRGQGTVIRDAGWVRFLENGLVVRGPHPFPETDPAEVYC